MQAITGAEHIIPQGGCHGETMITHSSHRISQSPTGFSDLTKQCVGYQVVPLNRSVESLESGSWKDKTHVWQWRKKP